MEALITDHSHIPHRFRIGDAVVNAATYLASLNDHSASELAAELAIADGP
jgi:hypothetical protein